jgi:uncharacterized protein (DUF1778 family)
MSQSTKRRQTPLSMRLPEADIAVIDRAASLRGRSRTDFVREAAVRAAEEILMEHAMPRLTAQACVEFMAALDAPAKPIPELLEVLNRRAPWEKPPQG